MRSQKREFVVEYKSRRKTQASPKSIWANVDLTAAAQAVDADANLLFKPKGPAGIGDDSAWSPKRMSPAELATPVEDSSESCADLSNENAAAAIAVVVPETTVLTDKEVMPVRRRKSVRMGISKVREPRRDPVQIDDGPVSQGELVLLQAENARLKLMLRANLVRDNELLRTMLERFGR
jgi:hypothetical protein